MGQKSHWAKRREASTQRVADRWLEAAMADITLEGDAHLIERMKLLLQAVQALGNWGASRTVSISIDGDGADRLKVTGLNKLTKALRESLDDATNRDVVHVGEKGFYGTKSAGAYDPESWYYEWEPGVDLDAIISRWQHNDPRQKMYDSSMPLMLSVKELWPLREYTWSRDNSRGGFAKVKGKSVHLPGELKWDAIKEDMRARGWDPKDPLLLEIGSEGGVKVGEGNHRLAIARELGMRKVPVRFLFKSYRVGSCSLKST